MLFCFVLCLIIASPVLALVASLRGAERFSELWLLGAGHMAEDFPSTVESRSVYKVYLGVGNHMGGLEYYQVSVKLGNQTESSPDASSAAPSALDSLFEYRVFVGDGEAWEKEIQFSFENVSFEGSSCTVTGLVLDGRVFSTDTATAWDAENRGFYVQLFFELWRYNAALSGFQYHNRFVGLWLNMTCPG